MASGRGRGVVADLEGDVECVWGEGLEGGGLEVGCCCCWHGGIEGVTEDVSEVYRRSSCKYVMTQG